MKSWKVEICLGCSLITLLLLRTALRANRIFRNDYADQWLDTTTSNTRQRRGPQKRRAAAGTNDAERAMRMKQKRDSILASLYAPNGNLYNTTAEMTALIDHINDYTRCTHDAIPPLRGRATKAVRTDAERARWNPETACRFDPGEHAAKFDNLYTCNIGETQITIPKAPSFVIIGAQKGGTTSMFDHLLDHPNIRPTMNWFLSGQLRHEVHFFDFEWGPLERGNDFKKQSNFFCLAAKSYVEINYDVNTLLKADLYGETMLSFEKTPRYILRPNIAEKMKMTVPWVTRLIAVLRDPVDRAFSEFNMDTQRMRSVMETPQEFDKSVREELMHLQQNGLVRRSYDFSGNNIPEEIVPPELSPAQEEAIFTKVEPQRPRYIKRGMYAVQLISWAREYSIPDNLLVLNSGNFHFGGEQETFHRVLRHVGLPYHDKQDFDVVHKRSYSFDMLNSTRELLEKFYEPYNARLAGILGKEWEGVWRYVKPAEV